MFWSSSPVIAEWCWSDYELDEVGQSREKGHEGGVPQSG
jgi:hypothetical protein